MRNRSPGLRIDLWSSSSPSPSPSPSTSSVCALFSRAGRARLASLASDLAEQGPPKSPPDPKEGGARRRRGGESPRAARGEGPGATAQSPLPARADGFFSPSRTAPGPPPFFPRLNSLLLVFFPLARFCGNKTRIENRAGKAHPAPPARRERRGGLSCRLPRRGLPAGPRPEAGRDRHQARMHALDSFCSEHRDVAIRDVAIEMSRSRCRPDIPRGAAPRPPPVKTAL